MCFFNCIRRGATTITTTITTNHKGDHQQQDTPLFGPLSWAPPLWFLLLPRRVADADAALPHLLSGSLVDPGVAGKALGLPHALVLGQLLDAAIALVGVGAQELLGAPLKHLRREVANGGGGGYLQEADEGDGQTRMGREKAGADEGRRRKEGRGGEEGRRR